MYHPNMAQAPSRRVSLRDPVNQAEFAERGYTVVDLVEPDVVTGLAERFFSIYSGASSGFHSSLECDDYTYREALHQELLATFGARVDELVVDHTVSMSGATVKWPEGDSTVNMHQDWTLVDETRFRSFNFWIPLVDTCHENGGMYVLPGSHMVYSQLRPHGGYPTGYIEPASYLELDTFVPVPVRAGQALIQDHALFHCGPPNRASAPRVAVLMGMTPNEADRSHYFRDQDDRITRYAISDPSFFRKVVAFQDPAPLLAGTPTEPVEFDGVNPVETRAATEPAATVDQSSNEQGEAGGSHLDVPKSDRESLWRHLRRRSRAVSADR